jgi:signal transduction histidine kinase
MIPAHPKILLVDDHPHDSELAALVLQDQLNTSEIILVSDAVEFADNLAQGGFDAVVLEMQLGWADGARILQSIRRQHPDCPVIVFSSESTQATINPLGPDRPDGFVVKSSSGYLHLPAAIRQAFETDVPASPAQEDTASLLDRLPVGVFQLSKEGILQCLNTACADIFRVTRDANNKAGALADLLSGDIAQTRIASAVRQGFRLDNFDTQLAIRENSPVWLRLSFWPVSSEDGEDYFEGIVTDISNFREVVSKLSRNAEELSRSNADLEKFAYVASHDLQEPLSYITRYARLLNDRYDLDEDANRYMEHITQSSNRLQSMVDDILEYSRVGTRGESFEPVDFGAMVETAAISLDSLFKEYGVKLEVNDLPTIDADARQIHQLFQNLFSNAIKFHGDQAPKITVSADEVAGQWQFSVRDNGIGIPPEAKERIFEMFQRLHTTEEHPGNGIGLAICRSIVERHGGSIWVESTPGEGSVFYFTISHKPASEDWQEKVEA